MSNFVFQHGGIRQWLALSILSRLALLVAQTLRTTVGVALRALLMIILFKSNEGDRVNQRQQRRWQLKCLCGVLFV